LGLIKGGEFIDQMKAISSSRILLHGVGYGWKMTAGEVGLPNVFSIQVLG
jgi:hypothetical protein